MNNLPSHFIFLIKSLSISGGAERVFVDVVNGLSARGFDTKVVSFDRPGTPSFYPLYEDVMWVRLGIGDARRPARPIETLRRIWALRRILRSEPVAVCVGFMHSSYVPAGIAGVGTSVPVLASEHIVPEHYRWNPLQKLFLRTAPRFVAAITVVSPSVKSLFPEPLRSRMVVVPNPVSVHVDKTANTAGSGLERKTLLSVGRLSKQKDYATLVEAFARIATRQSRWDLRIVGDGPMRRSLERQIRDLDLKGRICLAGTIKDVGTEYQSAQLFVLPSLYESQGLSAIEAIAHGLPVVAFQDCSGLSDFLIDGVNSCLAHGTDRVRALATSLELLMGDDDRRLSLVSPNSVDLQANSLERVLDQWTATLKQYAPTTIG